ncbi:hypothetical protein ACHAXM_003108 [Skeletonema potamos]|jgi:hypothetical protein
MVSTGNFFFVCAAAAAFLSSSDAFSLSGVGGGRRRPTSLHLNEPKGCASTPFAKKKIAVFGAGGYLGATVFGFLQRAGSLYGTGISGQSSPRAIAATSSSAEALNKVLGSAFKLAYAGEDLIRLVDTSDVDHITERVKSFDAAVLGTVYQLEKRTVTLNTYEKSPNDRTYDFYLDEKYGAWENDVPSDDSDYHVQIFKNAIQALVEAGSINHLVVVETPRTNDPMVFINILDEAGIPYTYVRIKGKLIKDISFTFDKGVKDSLAVSKFQPGFIYPIEAGVYENERPVYREDVAALVVQSLMSLDWNESRILEVASSPNPLNISVPSKKQRSDKDWCTNSALLEKSLSVETVSPVQIKELGISTQR